MSEQNQTIELLMHRVRSIQKRFSVENYRGESVLIVSPKLLAATRTTIISDTEDKRIAQIKQCISPIVPKYHILIDDGESFYVQRKFSLEHNYLIKGMPWELHGNFTGFKYRAHNHTSNAVIFEIEKEMNKWDDRYQLTVYERKFLHHAVCVAVSVDLAIAAMQQTHQN